MNLHKLDSLDDEIFKVVCEVNELLDIDLDVTAMNHTELIINVREFIKDELKRQGGDE